MMERLDRLRDRLQESDINERNRPASLVSRKTIWDNWNSIEENRLIDHWCTTNRLRKSAHSTGCESLPSKTRKGPILMISPLISLMDDQRAQWETFSMISKTQSLLLEIPKVSVVSSNNRRNRTSDEDDEYDESRWNRHPMLLTGNTAQFPRDRPMWINRLTSLENPISMLVIDEAHIVGDWGASIRPEFQLLGQVKDRLLHANPIYGFYFYLQQSQKRRNWVNSLVQSRIAAKSDNPNWKNTPWFVLPFGNSGNEWGWFRLFGADYSIA